MGPPIGFETLLHRFQCLEQADDVVGLRANTTGWLSLFSHYVLKIFIPFPQSRLDDVLPEDRTGVHKQDLSQKESIGVQSCAILYAGVFDFEQFGTRVLLRSFQCKLPAKQQTCGMPTRKLKSKNDATTLRA